MDVVPVLPATATLPAPIEIGERRRPLIARILLWGGLAALAGLVATGEGETPFARGGLLATAVGLTVAAFLTLLRLIDRRPALRLAPGDFAVPRLLITPVPWRAVAFMTSIPARRGARLVLTLRPGSATVACRPRRLALALRLARPDRLTLALDRLDIPSRQAAALVEQHIRAARADDEPVSLDLPQPLAAAEGRPVLAYGLLALLVAIYAGETALSLRPAARFDIDVETLLALGGTVRALVVEHGQLWRLVTAPLLHGSVLHLLFNGWALLLAARLLETRIGWRWFAATFVASALGGSLASVLTNPANLVGVGASGGIVGLSAATAVVAFRFPIGAVRSRMLLGSLGILVPSLLPAALQVRIAGATVDVAAHAGGALGGGLTGAALLALWPHHRRVPRGGGLALAFAAAFMLVAAACLVPVTRAYRAGAALAPDFPRDIAAARAQATDLLARYPRDPRVRYVHALALLQRGDLLGARHDLEAALADAATLRATVVDMDPYLRGLLALVLSEDNDGPAAGRLLLGRCPAVEAVYHDVLREKRLCP